MTAPRDDNLYAPPTADVAGGPSAKVPPSVVLRFLVVLLPCSVVTLFLTPFIIDVREGTALWLRALAVIAAWPLPVMLILLPSMRAAGGWSKLSRRTALLVGLAYPVAALLLVMVLAFVLLVTAEWLAGY